MIAGLTPAITWIRVDRPTLDLAGVILSSLGLAAVFSAGALLLGSLLGLYLIRRGRRVGMADLGAPIVLRLDPPRA